MERVDAVVIGAGVIGLAVGRALAQAGREVIIVEREADIGTQTSSRNSEVIHAGIYYPRNSLKAQLCVEGKALLYQHCADYGIPHARYGKLIVATRDEELPILRGYQDAALANGVGELGWLDEAAVAELEPAVRCRAGVYSASTGVVDSHAFMTSLLGDVEAGGGMLALNTEVIDGAVQADGIRVDTSDLSLTASIVVNAAGLSAPNMARQLLGGTDVTTPAAYFAKGHYYAYSGASPFSRLVYPVAEAGGLGVHVTVDLGGQARFGPDVTWIDGIDYGFDDSRRGDFVAAIARYFPDLDESRLHPGYTGIRPKITAPGEPAADFMILGPSDHGHAGLVHLLGIESPGLTASLSIAERVLKILSVVAE